MPTVPGSEPVHDPFKTKSKGKSQDRVPSAPAPARPSDEMIIMAAASMRDMGRLYAPVEPPTPQILSKVRAEYWAEADAQPKVP